MSRPKLSKREDEVYSWVGRHIAARRSILRMSQTELAESTDLCRGTIANIETGRQRVRLHTLLDLAEVLGVSVRSLVPEAWDRL